MLALRRDLSMSKYMRDPVRAHVGFAANMFNKMSMQCTLLSICVYMVSVMHICAGVTRFPFGVPHFIDTNHNLRNCRWVTRVSPPVASMTNFNHMNLYCTHAASYFYYVPPHSPGSILFATSHGQRPHLAYQTITFSNQSTFFLYGSILSYIFRVSWYCVWGSRIENQTRSQGLVHVGLKSLGTCQHPAACMGFRQKKTEHF
jgi:hypothetical protein